MKLEQIGDVYRVQWRHKSSVIVIDFCLVLLFPVNNDLQVFHGGTIVKSAKGTQAAFHLCYSQQ